DPGEVVKGPLDPSRGSLLAIQKDVPNLQERIDAGGVIGKIILVVLAVGLVLGVLRLIMLLMTSMAVRSQASNPENPKKGNPLGRVLRVYEDNKDEDIETLELKLDEQILRENAKLELGLNFLKLIAAVAPLLGLLGTVTGMIRTFQAITLFGTGDPQIMADGISEALVTTVLGLVTAIPILLLHSFASSAARASQQTLDEQAAGLVAQRAERRTAG
ncbi:MAG: MotA/TolQ/ExbB proton channel family protein, partial [Euryhalocaulis sp.]|uniref:MotA/TolQ/ExbB proton channel family protein n=1 Tax=Euryhalocaulis sp. TaxID=2744307 RepID=UPI0018213F00